MPGKGVFGGHGDVSHPLLRHAHSSPKAEQGQGQGLPIPNLLTRDHHPLLSLPPTHHGLYRIPINFQNHVGFP
jgi:hypothetical protein